MRKLILSILLSIPILGFSQSIDIEKITNTIKAKHTIQDDFLLKRGIQQSAAMWMADSLNAEEFEKFCMENWINNDLEKEQAVIRIAEHFNNHNYYSASRSTTDYFVRHHENKMVIDEMFDKSFPTLNLSKEYYNNKIPYYIVLNFPKYSLEEKETLGKDWSSKEWAYARMGDKYNAKRKVTTPKKKSENPLDKISASQYIADYNIYMGYVLDEKGKQLFPDDMILLSHWNLRDEIKANYNKGEKGLIKQRTVAKVMERIVSQEIPVESINKGEYLWNPFTNNLYNGNRKIKYTPEDSVRYYILKRNFNPNAQWNDSKIAQIDSKFSGELEMNVNYVEELFESLLLSPERIMVANIIRERLGRNLEGFDIWYDGFKSRSALNMDSLDIVLKNKYPTAKELEADLPIFLEQVGYSPIRAREIAWKVQVDPDKGSGHAAGASFKGGKSKLRTRFLKDGLDYKGYNIAVHEFGHNVEQTISLYEVPYLALKGIPNTAFSEAMAFIMQKRDLTFLGLENNSPEQEILDILDAFWNAYEIMGVGMLDIKVWRWMYANPNFTTSQLKEAVIKLSKDVWNKYYADAFGIKDQTLLAAYSHMLHYPLYLSAYPIGHLIAFQVNEYLKGKDLPTEIDRIYRLGRLTPNEWMQRATGEEISTEPLLRAVRDITN